MLKSGPKEVLALGQARKSSRSESSSFGGARGVRQCCWSPPASISSLLTKGGGGCAEVLQVIIRMSRCAPESNEKNCAEAAGIFFQRRRAEKAVGQVLGCLLDPATINDEFTIHALKMRLTQAEKVGRLWG